MQVTASQLGRKAGVYLWVNCALGLTAVAQTGSQPATAATAPSGSTAVESVVISYEATNELARELAKNFCGTAEQPAPKDSASEYSRLFLLGTASNLSAIQGSISFNTALNQLKQQYENLSGPPGSSPPAAAPKLAFPAGASAAVQAVTAAVGAVKTQTTQTATTFTPVDQVLFSDLQKEMNLSHCVLVTTAYPDEINEAARAIQAQLDMLLSTRAAKLKARYNNDWTQYKNDTEVQTLDGQLSTLEESLGNETPNMTGPSILIGQALSKRLGAKYHVLTIVNAAAGGGTRANTYFLLNVLVPAPHPSYNGGTAVAYSLQKNTGDYESANTLYFVFGYTKWKQPPLRNQATQGFTNFSWDGSNNRGHWQPVY